MIGRTFRRLIGYLSGNAPTGVIPSPVQGPRKVKQEPRSVSRMFFARIAESHRSPGVMQGSKSLLFEDAEGRERAWRRRRHLETTQDRIRHAKENRISGVMPS